MFSKNSTLLMLRTLAAFSVTLDKLWNKHFRNRINCSDWLIEFQFSEKHSVSFTWDQYTFGLYLLFNMELCTAFTVERGKKIHYSFFPIYKYIHIHEKS